MNHPFDLLIVGGGPIGMSCAIEAQKAGLSYVIIEKGCLVNSLYNYPANMVFFSTSEKLEIGGVPFVSNNIKPTRAEALEYYRRVADKFNLNLRLFEKVNEIKKGAVHFLVNSDKAEYQAKNIIITTGFYDFPNLMNIPGEDLPKVRHYYKDPHFYAQQRVVVIGANNSSVDAALETFRKGAEVTMVIRSGQVGERVKYWVRPDIVNRIQEGSIKAYFNSTITAVREFEVDIESPDGPVTLANDFVLAMTGYQPDFTFLERAGVNLSEDELRIPEHNPETMETNIKGLYLAGVVCGGMNTHKWFIENSREHGERITNHILKGIQK